MGRWRAAGGVSRRIALSALMLTLLMLVGIGLISSGTLYLSLRQNIESELDADSRLLQQQFDRALNSVAADIAKLSASSFIRKGISDPGGYETYLRPLLQEYLPPVPHPVQLVVFDAQGMPVMSNVADDLGRFSGMEQVRDAIFNARPSARVQHENSTTHMLRLVYPLQSHPAGAVHGALLGTVRLDSILQDGFALLNPKTTRHEFLVGGPLVTNREWYADQKFVQRIWKAKLVEPLDMLRLHVRIGQERATAMAPLSNMMVLHALFGILLVCFALYLARGIGRRLASPIRELSRTAGAIAASGSFHIKAEVSGEDEVASLARAFNDMLDRLYRSHVLLQLRKSEFMALVENSPDLIARFDRHLRCTYVNPMVETYFGIAPAHVAGRTAQELGVHEDILRLMSRVFEVGGEHVHEYEANGRFLEARLVAECDAAGHIVSLLGIMRDVTARRRAEESLRLANRAIESSGRPVIIASCDEPDYPVKYVNPAFERVTGYALEEVRGRNCRFLQGEDRTQPELEGVRSALRERREIQVVLRNYRKDGSGFWNELTICPVLDGKGVATHFVGEINDVTTEREQREQLQYQATHDALTGLPNRTLLTDRLKQALSYAQRYERVLAVAFLDLDKFKFINDSLGHDIGDKLLRKVAERLLSCVRESDTVARLGGDEFVLVLYDQGNGNLASQTMERVRESVSRPMQLGGQTLSVTCSIGFAVYPRDGQDADTLIRNADAAMYRAKELGRDNFQFYTDQLHDRISERLTMETGLRRAVEQDELVLHYQPQIDLRTGRVCGLEALVRWRHPQLGLVPPVRFIPLAEETGLIHRIGDWVMRAACLQHRDWQRLGLPHATISVNVSTPQFLQKGFIDIVASVLGDTGMDPGCLELEITESLSMQDPDRTLRVLHELKEMGVRLSIDDFGTGYSNLSYMKQFPIDKIKLDQSFVRDVVCNPQDLAITDAVISMGHSLHLRVMAEGVETEAQLALLARRGCDEIQGRYFSSALPAVECTALLQAGRALSMDSLIPHGTEHTVLLIDRDQQLLMQLEPGLRSAGCHVVTASGMHDAFDLMAMHDVGVILCDRDTAPLHVADFFGRVRQMYPATVRMQSGTGTGAACASADTGGDCTPVRKPRDQDALCVEIIEALARYRGERAGR